MTSDEQELTLSTSQRLNIFSERRFNAAGSDRAPTDPRLESAEKPDQNKDRAKESGNRQQAAASQQEYYRSAASRSTAFVVDVLFHWKKVDS